MTNDYSDLEIEEFSQRLYDSYEERSLLREFATIEDFESYHQNVDFFQIATRYKKLDIGWIKGHRARKAYADDDFLVKITRSLVLGERNYLVSQIENLAEENELHKESISEFNIDMLRGSLNSFNGVTDVFIPVEKSSEIINYSVRNSEIIDRDYRGFPYYRFPEFNLFVLGENSDVNNIVVLNSNALSIVQKTKEDMRKSNKPDEVPEIHMNELDISKGLGRNQRLMLYLGDSEEKDTIDFMYRTVLGLKKPNEKDAGIISYGE